MNDIRLEKDSNQIVTLTFDAQGQSANTMNAAFRDSLRAVTQKIVADKANIKGILLTSAKSTFFAGGDLKELSQIGPEDADKVFALVEGIKADLRTIETLGVPVVAAINGTALGGGWEIALACHHRLLLNDPKVRIGLSAVSQGLLPGGGRVSGRQRGPSDSDWVVGGGVGPPLRPPHLAGGPHRGPFRPGEFLPGPNAAGGRSAGPQADAGSGRGPAGRRRAPAPAASRPSDRAE